MMVVELLKSICGVLFLGKNWIYRLPEYEAMGVKRN